MGQAKWHLARAKNLLLPPCRRQPATFAASSIAGRSAKTDMSANLQVDGAAAAAAVVGNHDAAASAAATLLALSKGRISRLQQIEQRRKEIQEEAKRLSAQECIASQTTSTSEYLAPTRHRLHGIPCRRKNLHQGRRKRRQIVLPHTRRSAPPERDATKLDFGILRHNKK
jgi:hypothetical protein